MNENSVQYNTIAQLFMTEIFQAITLCIALWDSLDYSLSSRSSSYMLV